MTMAAQLEPVTEFRATELEPVMRNLAVKNWHHLTRERYLPLVTGDYAELRPDEPGRSIARLQKRHNEPDTRMEAFVILGDGKPRGMATVRAYPEAGLQKLQAPLPPLLIRCLRPAILQHLALTPPHPLYNLHVSAWVDSTLGRDDQAGLLRFSYASLTTHAWRLGDAYRMVDPLPWTIEPARSPQVVHESIQKGGYVIPRYGRPARYDAQENDRLRRPPPSRLYVARP